MAGVPHRSFAQFEAERYMALPNCGGSVVFVALALLFLLHKTRTPICFIPLRQSNLLPVGISELYLVDGNIYRDFPPYGLYLAWGVDARY